MSNLLAKEYQGFEQIKHTDGSDNEYWFARELASALEYVEWRNFSKVLDRAMLACQNSGFNLADHFVEVSKTIEMPSKPQKIGFAEVSKTKNAEIGFPEVGKTKDTKIGFVEVNKTKQKILDYMNSKELIANLLKNNYL